MPFASKNDLLDLDCSERLTVTLLLALVLLCLVLEDDDLLVLVLRSNGSGHFRVLNILADLDIRTVRDHDDVEGNLCAHFCAQLFHLDDIAFGNLVLLSAVFDDCVHDSFYLLFPVSQAT